MAETFYLHLVFKNKRGNWSINLPFLCNRCGVCCTLDDFLTAGEINASPQQQPQVHAKMKAISEALGKIWENSESEYEKYIQRTSCPFLEEKLCSIYQIRPNGCRQFPNTLFGMLTQNCKALNRFKKMRAILRKGKTAKETYYSFKDGEHTSTSFTEKQMQTCVTKLRRAGITDEEFALFTSINK